MWLIKPFTLQLNMPKKGPRWKKAALNLKTAWAAPESQSQRNLHVLVQLTKIYLVWILRSSGDVLIQGNLLVLMSVQAPSVRGCLASWRRGWDAAIAWDWECVKDSSKSNWGHIIPYCGFRLEIRKRLSSSRTWLGEQPTEPAPEPEAKVSGPCWEAE